MAGGKLFHTADPQKANLRFPNLRCPVDVCNCRPVDELG